MSPLTPGMPTPAAPCPLGCLLTPPHPRPPRPTLQQAESPSLCLEAPQPLAQPPEGILRFSSGHLRSLVGPLPSLLTGSCLLPWSALSQRGPGESHVGPTLLCSKPAPGLTRVNPSMFTPEGPGPPHPSWTAPSTCRPPATASTLLPQPSNLLSLPPDPCPQVSPQLLLRPLIQHPSAASSARPPLSVAGGRAQYTFVE